MKTWALGLLFALFAWSTSPAMAGGLLKRAHRLYEEGKCEEASSIFEKILQDSTQKKIHPEALFRIAYCDYTVGDYSDAEKGFRLFLQQVPGHLEAQLRLVETLIYLQDYDGALELLKQVKLPPDQRWLVSYWEGFSSYMTSDPVSAEKSFDAAATAAPPESWVSTEAIKWRQRLRDEYRRVRPSVDAGLMWDGNPSYSSTPESGGSPGAYLALGANTLLLRSRTWQLNLPINAYGSFFLNEPAKLYEFQTLSASLDASHVWNSRLSSSLSFSYLDTRLRYRYNQDSLTLAPGVSWRAGRGISLSLSPTVVRNILSNEAWVVAPSVTGSWSLGLWSAFATFSYAQSLGDRAVADPTVVASAAGRITSNYRAISGQLGISRSLPWKLLASAQVSLGSTWFSPQATEGSVPRRDKTFGYSASLSRELPIRGLNASLSASLTRNLSQGNVVVIDDAGNAYTFNYNYVRPLVSLSVSYVY